MKMKYYRFLYGEAGGCLMHFGQIRDTKTEEHFSFLYLRGTSGHVDRESAGHTLFLCPDTVDLAVLGNTDPKASEVLKGLLASAKVRTVVLPEGAVCEVPEKKGEEAPEIIRLAAGEKEAGWQMTAAGWCVYVKSYQSDSVVMAHSLAETDTAGNRFEDCVMSVKTMDGTEKCIREREPDGYGCALGCTQNHDFDVCKHRRADGPCGYRTGTVLLPALEKGNTLSELKAALRSDLNGKVCGIRFIGMARTAGETDAVRDTGADSVQDGEDAGYKRYFIGAKSELDDRTVAAVSRGGLNHIPVLLEDGKAVCCSGLLKYKESEEA